MAESHHKNGANDTNKHLRKIIPSTNWTLSIQVHVHPDTGKPSVDFEITTFQHMALYAIYRDESFSKLAAEKILKFITDDFKGCHFSNNENGKLAMLEFGEAMPPIHLPEVANKEKHHQQLLIQLNEEVTDLNQQVALLKQENAQLRQDVDGNQQHKMAFKKHLHHNAFESALVPFGSDDYRMITEFFGTDRMNWKLLFRFSRDGKSAESFHQHCDNKGPTLVIVQCNEQPKCFGGYSSASWQSHEQGVYISAPDSFLFSCLAKLKYPLVQGKESFAIQHRTAYGPIFGDASDMWITTDGYNSGTSPNSTYGRPGMTSYNSAEPKHNFDVKEYEVFGVEIIE